MTKWLSVLVLLGGGFALAAPPPIPKSDTPLPFGFERLAPPPKAEAAAPVKADAPVLMSEDGSYLAKLWLIGVKNNEDVFWDIYDAKMRQTLDVEIYEDGSTAKIAVAGPKGKYTARARGKVGSRKFDLKKTFEIKQGTVVPDVVPIDPKVDPKVDPVVPPVVPTGDFRLIFVRETGPGSVLTSEQLAAMNSEAVRKYLDAKTVRTSAGGAGYMTVDPDVPPDDDRIQDPDMRALWRDARPKVTEAIRANPNVLPVVIVAVGKSSEVHKLPEGEANALTFYKKYGGQ